MSIKVLKPSGVSNPNLLINGDFQVWQRGEAFSDKTQLVNKYTADRWRVNYKGLTSSLRILKNSLSYGMYIDKKNTAGEVEICQIIENADLYLNKDLTLSICISIASQKITKSYTIKLTSSTTESMETNAQYYFGFRYSSSTNNLVVVFGIKAIVDCAIDWIKLEEGQLATRKTSKAYTEEMLLCSRYFRTETVTGVLYRQASGYDYFRVITNNNFRIVPTTKLISAEIPYVGNVPIYQTIGQTEKGEFAALITSANANGGKIVNILVQYDAEIY